VHDRVLGFGHAGVRAAFCQAWDRNLYRAVAVRQPGWYGDWDTTGGPAYARTNEREYFAELSTCWLGCSNSSFPFTLAELERVDPAGFAFVRGVWQEREYVVVNDLPHAVAVLRAGEGDRFAHLFNLDAGERRLLATWPNTRLGYRQMVDDVVQRCGGPNGGEWHVRPATTGR
jgi:hypothetical protein